MPQITVVLALASPLLHARLRAELALDPGIMVLHDTGSAVRAVEEAVKLRPHVLFCDREMLLDQALAALPRQLKPPPAVVLITVFKEGIPARHVLPVAGTLPFDTRPGELSRQLGEILARQPAETRPVPPPPPPMRSELQYRFTMEQSEPKPMPTSASITDLATPPYAKGPMPSKTSHLAQTGFLRSVFDIQHEVDEQTPSKSGRL